jgi:teichuronic acid biosynthesis glycosyltransferase TuaC
MLRLAVVTPLFPVADEPYRGIPIYNTVLELQKLAEVRVFCPVATYPRWKRLQPSAYIYRPLDPSYRPAGVDAEYFPYPALPLVSRPANGFVCARNLLPRLRPFRPDLVLAYWLYPEGFGALLAGHKLGVPVVGGARGSDLHRPPDPVSRYLLRRTLRGMDGVLAVSKEMRGRAIEYGVAPDRIRAIPNGCDTTLFHPADRGEARRELGIAPEEEIILFVGHLIPGKGLAELVDAFAVLAAERPRLRLVCVGEGSWKSEWSERLQALRLTDRLRLPGACPPSAVARWMAACDVFCLPSHSEGCPNVVIEALACGRPVVATGVGATPDLVDGAHGIVVPPRDAPALTAALRDALGRDWEPGGQTIFRRGWSDVARETLDFCRVALERFRPAGETREAC